MFVSSSELRSTSQRATSNTGTYYRRYADTQSKRQRTPFTYTRETDENNTDPFRQRTQFTSSKEAKTQEQPKAKIGVSVKCIDCNECHQELL